MSDGVRRGVTVEKAAWAAVGLLAAWLRWFELGVPPLKEGEAAQAMAAYRFLHGAAPGTPQGTVPALFAGNLAGFTLLGASDGVARWLPALLGVVLVLLPYGLRHRLGRGGALAAALLLALSPSAVRFSRALDGSILVAACGLALVGGLIRYVDGLGSAGLYLAAVALGLGLCAGPGIYTLLLIWAVYALVLYLADRPWGRPAAGGGPPRTVHWGAVRQAWQALRDQKGLAGGVALAGAVTFGLIATTFALHPGGVGHAADLLGRWALDFGPEPGGQPALFPLLLLARYETAIVLLGLVMLVSAWRMPSPAFRHRIPHPESPATGHIPFLTFWATASTLILVVSGHRPAGNILLAVIPLALLAGQGIERAWQWVARGDLWREAGAVAAGALGLAIFFYLQMTAYALTDDLSMVTFLGNTISTGTAYLLLALLALVLLVGLAATVWLWRGRGSLVAGGWLALLVALSLWSFKSAWAVGHSQATNPRELLVDQPTAPDVRAFVRQVEKLSLDEAGDKHTLPLTVDLDTGAVVAWYLRGFDRQTALQALSGPPATRAVVTLGLQDLAIGETYRGTGFPLRTRWQPWGLSGKPLVRWLFFDRGSLPTVEREVVLWVAAQP